MKILIAAESFQPRTNGVANSVSQISKFLRANGDEVAIIAPGRGSSISNEQVKVFRIPSISLNKIASVDISFGGINEIREIFEEFNPDIIHLASPLLLGEKVLRVALEMGVPTIAVFQTDISGFAKHYGGEFATRAIESKLARIHGNANLNLAPSTHTIEYLAGLGVLNTQLWGRGVDHSIFNSSMFNKELRRRWNSDPGTRFVGYVGRLSIEKSIQNLVNLQQYRSIQIVLIGDGPDRRRLERIFPSAIFTGMLKGKSLGEAMASLDVLAATGEHETFCQVIQEGMAASVPVVAPNIGGPKDLIHNGVNGILYQPKNQKSLSEAVLKLLSDREYSDEIAYRGNISVANKTWLNLFQELYKHYLYVMSVSHRGAA